MTYIQKREYDQTFGTRSGDSVRAFFCCWESGEVISSEAFRFTSGPGLSNESKNLSISTTQPATYSRLPLPPCCLGYAVVLCCVASRRERESHGISTSDTGPSVGETLDPDHRMGQIIPNSFNCDSTINRQTAANRLDLNISPSSLPSRSLS